MNQKGFSSIIVLVVIIGIAIVGVVSYLTFASISEDKNKVDFVDVTNSTDTNPEVQPSVANKPNSSSVIISIDKTKYDKGENIKIVVNNKLDTPILYSSGGDKFWGIEYFKEGKWINPAYEEGGSFQLTEDNIGDTCHIKLYERMPPTELKSEAALSSQWDQKICPFGTTSPAEPKIVRYIKGGQYRFIFQYGFEISDDDPYILSNFKTVYSDSFTIK